MAATSPEELLADWGRLINAGDLEAVLTLYEPDAVAVVPKADGGPVRGKDGVRQVLEPFLALEPTFTLVLNRSTVAGEVALMVGDWSVEGTGPDGSPVTMNGRFRDVFHRQPDRTWLIAIDNPFGDD